MTGKITSDHLSRSAVVYVRQSTMSQVMGNLESQRRQYDLAAAAQKAGFIGVTVIDEDLGRSGSGSTHRPGFERLVAMVCSGNVGAVYCIEASRLARNGRDWHHLIDLCALAGALVIDRAQLFQLAHDLPAAWNAASTDTGTKQRLIHILVQEIVCDLDDAANEAVLLIHWTGGRHTEVRVPRVKTGRYPGDIAPSAVDALRQLAGHWPDRELAVALNRMRCKTGDGETWTTVRVREMRERLGLAEYNPQEAGPRMVSLAKAAEQLGICVGSAKSLALRGILPATQAMKGAQWLVPADALTSEAVRIGVQRVVERRPKIYESYQYDNLVRLPGI